MIPHLWLAYVPAFLVFIIVGLCKGVGSRWALGVAGLAIVGGSMFILQTVLPNPSRSFLNWLPLIVLAVSLALLAGRYWRLCAFLVCVAAGVIFIHKVCKINPSWSVAEQLLNSVFILGLPLLAVWYSFAGRKQGELEMPMFHFGLFGFTVLVAIVCYIIAGTSQTAIIVACVGVLCSAGFILSIKDRTNVDTRSLGLLFGLILWMCTIYVHYFTEKIPLLITIYLLLAPVVIGIANFSGLVLKWRIVVPLILIVLGGCAAGYMIWQDSANDEYGY